MPGIGLYARASRNGVFILYYLLFSRSLGLNVTLPRVHNIIPIRDRIVEVSDGESCFWSIILQPNFGSDIRLLKLALV